MEIDIYIYRRTDRQIDLTFQISNKHYFHIQECEDEQSFSSVQFSLCLSNWLKSLNSLVVKTEGFEICII